MNAATGNPPSLPTLLKSPPPPTSPELGYPASRPEPAFPELATTEPQSAKATSRGNRRSAFPGVLKISADPFRVPPQLPVALALLGGPPPPCNSLPQPALETTVTGTLLPKRLVPGLPVCPHSVYQLPLPCSPHQPSPLPVAAHPTPPERPPRAATGRSDPLWPPLPALVPTAALSREPLKHCQPTTAAATAVFPAAPSRTRPAPAGETFPGALPTGPDWLALVPTAATSRTRPAPAHATLPTKPDWLALVPTAALSRTRPASAHATLPTKPDWLALVPTAAPSGGPSKHCQSTTAETAVFPAAPPRTRPVPAGETFPTAAPSGGPSKHCQSTTAAGGLPGASTDRPNFPAETAVFPAAPPMARPVPAGETFPNAVPTGPNPLVPLVPLGSGVPGFSPHLGSASAAALVPGGALLGSPETPPGPAHPGPKLQRGTAAAGPPIPDYFLLPAAAAPSQTL